MKSLKELYNSFFEKQRHKFAGHFQKVNLGERIELWSQIDFSTTSFFTDAPLELYNRFLGVSNFEDTTSLFPELTSPEIVRIANVNIKHDFEKESTMASDVLALTRSGAGGIVHSGDFQNQCGALNALQLIIPFELDLCEALQGNDKAQDLIKKMLIVDVVNFADNFFTRTDVAPGDPQYYPGLDTMIPAGHDEPKEIIKQFRETYKFQDKLARIRTVRDKACSHIDTASSIADIKILMDSISLAEVKDFYYVLSALLERVYRSDILFSFFLVNNQPMGDEVYFETLPTHAFDKNDPLPNLNRTPVRHNYNDPEIVKNSLEAIVLNPGDKDARKIISNGFNASESLKRDREEVHIEAGSFTYNYFELRRAHRVIIDWLNDPAIHPNKKIKIIGVFSEFSPDSEIRKILFASYEANRVNPVLHRMYIYAFGEICYGNAEGIVEKIQTLVPTQDIKLSYQCLLALFKIDIHIRTGNLPGRENVIEGPTSTFLKQQIENIEDPFYRMATACGLLSEFVNSRHIGYSWRALHSVYDTTFYYTFESALIELQNANLVPLNNADTMNQISTSLRNSDYTFALGSIADHFEKNGASRVAQLIYGLFLSGIVAINWHHDDSVRNYAAFLYSADKKAEGVQVLENLIKKNPHNIEYHGLYLTYLKEIDPPKFEHQKQELINNYQLSPEELEVLSKI